MYEFDHMLNGIGSRQHLQQIIRWVQLDKFARNVEVVQSKGKTISIRYTILGAVIPIIAPILK